MLLRGYRNRVLAPLCSHRHPANPGLSVDDTCPAGLDSRVANLASAAVPHPRQRPLDVWPELDGSIQAAYRGVTLAQLLAHQSGLPVDVAAIPSFDRVQDDAPGSVTDKRLLWAAELLALPPAGPVGGFLYSNAGYVVAGAMMEAVTGTPWETLMTDNVFGPLNMLGAGFGAPGTPGRVDEPWGHRSAGGGFEPVPPGPGADNPAALGPAGTVHGTLAAVAAYMQAHIAGERGRHCHTPFADPAYLQVLSSASLAAICRRRTQGTSMRERSGGDSWVFGNLRAPPAERYDAGKSRLEAVPLEAHAELMTGEGRPDPLEILSRQDASRLQDVIPIRYGRMSRNPFTFLRGAAAVMASDLAAVPRSDLIVERFEDAVVAFADRCADITELDHARLQSAIADGAIAAICDI